MKRRILADFLAVVEIRTKLVSVSTLLLASLYTVWRRGFPDPLLFACMWIATVAVDMGTTAFNNYFDYWRGTDRASDSSETDKVLVHSGVKPGFALAAAFWCFSAAAVFGLVIAFSGNLWVLPAGAACMSVGFLYTGGPFPISRTPFGEFFSGGCLGLSLFLIACGVWSVHPDAAVVYASLPSTLWIASILTVNNTCDIKGDTEAGRSTLSILVGVRGGETAVVLLGFLGQAAAVTAGLSGYLPSLTAWTGAFGIIPIAFVWRSMHRAGFSHGTKRANMMRILLCFVLFTLSTASGFLPLT